MRKNDLKAPRFRPDKGRIYIESAPFCKSYLEKHPSSSIKTPEQVNAVLKSIALKIREVASTTRDGFEIPHIGVLHHLAIGGLPLQKEKKGVIKEQMIDYKKSLELGKVIRHTNFDTDGKVLKIKMSYDLIKYKIPFRSDWVFKATRDYRRAASASFKKNFLIFKDKWHNNQ